mgnify:CR=1 FL=1
MAKKIRLVFEVQGAKGAEEKVKKVDTSLMGLAKKAGLVTLAFVGAGKMVDAFKSAVRIGSEFEQNIKNLSVVAGATGGKLKQLEQSALKLGGSTKFTASEVANLQIAYSKLGFTADEILEVTEGTLDLSTAFGLDLAQTAEVAGGTLRAFGLDASETARMTDVMALSFASTALDMEKFTGAMTMVGPVAKVAGFSLEETTAILGQLANANISGSLAGTQLRQIMLEMSNENSKLAKRLGGSVSSVDELKVALNKLNQEGIGTAEMKDLVGQRAVSAFSVLIDGADDVANLSTQFENATGTGNLMATQMLDTLESKFKIMKSASEDLGIAFFETFDDTLTKATEVMTDAIGGLSEFFKVIEESPLETAIRHIDELGGNTLELRTELAELNLEQAKSAELLPTISDAQEKQTQNTKDLIQVEKDLRIAEEDLAVTEAKIRDGRISGLRMSEIRAMVGGKNIDQDREAVLGLREKRDAILEDNEVQDEAIQKRLELQQAEADLKAVQQEALGVQATKTEQTTVEAEQTVVLQEMKKAEILILEEKLRLMEEGMTADQAMMETIQFQLDNAGSLELKEQKIIQLKIQKLGLIAKEAKAEQKKVDDKKKADDKEKTAEDKKADDKKKRDADEMMQLVANSKTAEEVVKKKIRLIAMEALTNLVAGIMRDYPFPANIMLAGVAGVAGMKAIDGVISLASSLSLQQGGFIPGFGGGDKVPAMLEKGEFVMNKEAVQNIGVSNLMAQNTGEGGGGPVFHFSGPVTNEDYVRDFIIPTIDDTLQRNLS